MNGCRILSCIGESESIISDRFKCLGGWGRPSRAGPCLSLGSRPGGGRVPGVLGHLTTGAVGVIGAHLGAHGPRVQGPSLASIV